MNAPKHATPLPDRDLHLESIYTAIGGAVNAIDNAHFVPEKDRAEMKKALGEMNVKVRRFGT